MQKLTPKRLWRADGGLEQCTQQRAGASPPRTWHQSRRAAAKSVKVLRDTRASEHTSFTSDSQQVCCSKRQPGKQECIKYLVAALASLQTVSLLLASGRMQRRWKLFEWRLGLGVYLDVHNLTHGCLGLGVPRS